MTHDIHAKLSSLTISAQKVRLVVDLDATHRNGLHPTHGSNEAGVPALEGATAEFLMEQALTF